MIKKIWFIIITIVLFFFSFTFWQEKHKSYEKHLQDNINNNIDIINSMIYNFYKKGDKDKVDKIKKEYKTIIMPSINTINSINTIRGWTILDEKCPKSCITHVVINKVQQTDKTKEQERIGQINKLASDIKSFVKKENAFISLYWTNNSKITLKNLFIWSLNKIGLLKYWLEQDVWFGNIIWFLYKTNDDFLIQFWNINFLNPAVSLWIFYYYFFKIIVLLLIIYIFFVSLLFPTIQKEEDDDSKMKRVFIFFMFLHYNVNVFNLLRIMLFSTEDEEITWKDWKKIKIINNYQLPFFIQIFISNDIRLSFVLYMIMWVITYLMVLKVFSWPIF